MKKSFPLKQTLIVAILVSIFIIVIKPIENQNIDDLPIDARQYRSMAAAAPGLEAKTWEPYAYRLLGPWLAGTIFSDPDLGLYLMNLLFLLAMALALWDLLLVYGIKPEPALLVVAAFGLNRYYFSFIAYDFYQLNDTISITCLWFSISFLKRRQLYFVLPIAIFGILAREILLIWIPVAFYMLYNQKNRKKEWVWVGLISLLLIIVFIGIRQIIPARGGIGLFQALADDWNKIIDPWAISKQLFVANTPLFLLPVIYYKSLYNFIKEYPEILVLLIITYLTTLFGHDYERLMAPAAPFIYLFTAGLIQRILNKDKSRNVLWGAIFFLIVIVGNFYHLWGIVILPDRLTTFIMTLVTGIAMGVLFLVTLKRRDFKT